MLNTLDFKNRSNHGTRQLYEIKSKTLAFTFFLIPEPLLDLDPCQASPGSEHVDIFWSPKELVLRIEVEKQLFLFFCLRRELDILPRDWFALCIFQNFRLGDVTYDSVSCLLRGLEIKIHFLCLDSHRCKRLNQGGIFEARLAGE